MALSRKNHPDLIPEGSSEEEREAMEALSSEINSAYRKLKNSSSRVDTLLAEIEAQKPEDFQLKNYVKLPMELSMEYFEIQELLEEGADQIGAQSQLQDFIEGVKQSQQKLKNAVDTALESQSSPLTTSEPSKTWEVPQEFLAEVAKSVGALRYLERILIDIKKFQ